jgi:hypothetical protein
VLDAVRYLFELDAREAAEAEREAEQAEHRAE